MIRARPEGGLRLQRSARKEGTMTNRSYLALSLLLITALCLAGCGGSDTAAPAPDSGSPASGQPDNAGADPGTVDQDGIVIYGAGGEPAQGDWFIWRLPAEMPTLNPLTSTDAYAIEIFQFVFSTLCDRDPITLEMTPCLAKSWDISEDKLTYTFHLRDDVTFSDGVPFTARDVKFTFDRIMDPSADTAHMRNYYRDVVACDVLDPHTVRFTCDNPYYRHLVILGLFEILPEHIYSQGDFNSAHNRTPVGTGRYVLEKWDTGLQVVLARNENYWGEAESGQPYFDKIIFKIMTDDNAAFQVLMAGDIDRMKLLPEDWVRRADTPRFKERFYRAAYDRPAYTYIGWNARKPMFADKAVRQALTMLLDRETIRDTIYQGLATVCTGTFMPKSLENNERIVAWPFDPQRAAAQLDETGWKDSDGDGLRDKDGVPFRFEVVATNQNPLAEQILTIYKEELRRAGIELNIRLLEWASLIERVQAREFDASTMAWAMPPDPDPYQVWHSSQATDGSNYVGFQNAEADRIIEEARLTFDLDKRVALYERFHEILHEEQPYTFVVISKELLAIDRRIHGVSMYPFEPDEREWYVPAALQRYGQ
jgi:peptide/nickel transport system substrate-binding protein